MELIDILPDAPFNFYIVDALLLLTVLACLRHFNRRTFKVAFSFVIMSILYKDLDLPGGWYYVGAGVCDFVTARLLYRCEKNKFSEWCIRLTLISLCVNGIGFIFYTWYLEPLFYNIAFIFIYLARLILVLSAIGGSSGDNNTRIERHDRGDNRDSNISNADNKSYHNFTSPLLEGNRC